MTVVDKCDQIHLALPIFSSHTTYLNNGNAEKPSGDIAHYVYCELFFPQNNIISSNNYSRPCWKYKDTMQYIGKYLATLPTVYF